MIASTYGLHSESADSDRSGSQSVYYRILSIACLLRGPVRCASTRRVWKNEPLNGVDINLLKFAPLNGVIYITKLATLNGVTCEKRLP